MLPDDEEDDVTTRQICEDTPKLGGSNFKRSKSKRASGSRRRPVAARGGHAAKGRRLNLKDLCSLARRVAESGKIKDEYYHSNPTLARSLCAGHRL